MAGEKTSNDDDFWPGLMKLRLYYDQQNKEAIEEIMQLQKLITSVRPGLDFKVVKDPSRDLEIW